MIRVLLVDDHAVVRAGCQRLLEIDGEAVVVAQAASADEGWQQFRRHAPDLTITDLGLPGSGGLELLRRMREVRRDARVIVFSMHCSESLVNRAFELGASGFVAKDQPPEALVEALRCVSRGGRYRAVEAARMQTGAADARAADGAALLRALTHREFEVLRLIATGRSVRDCARELHLSPKTVSNLQSLIKDKLGVATSAALARLALRHGLIDADLA